MKLHELTGWLEQLAPPAYQETYDNVGLLTGNPANSVKKALICLDCTEAVVEEAIREKCDLIIAHHPVIFKPLFSLTGKDHVERTLLLAIQKDIAIYAIHTNLDNIAQGVNAKLCEVLDIHDPEILRPKSGLLKKLNARCSPSQAKALREVLQHAGISEQKQGATAPPTVSPKSQSGSGSRLLSTPTVAGLGSSARNEVRIETVFPAHLETALLRAMHEVGNHEPFHYELVTLDNTLGGVGAGMIGKLERPVTEKTFLKKIKEKLKTGCIRHTPQLNKKVKQVAVCGGAGSFLLYDSIRAGADLFLTADFKYHQFFDAAGKIVIADAGHYETEQYTMELLHALLREKFPNFALRLTQVNTNPVNYF